MKNTANTSGERRIRRHRRIRSQVSGSASRPRLAVFRSNRYLSVQVIDDEKEKTLIGLSTKELAAKGTRTEQAGALGKKLAELAVERGISKVVFDRGGYLYTGNVKALADGAREGGLKF